MLLSDWSYFSATWLWSGRWSHFILCWSDKLDIQKRKMISMYWKWVFAALENNHWFWRGCPKWMLLVSTVRQRNIDVQIARICHRGLVFHWKHGGIVGLLYDPIQKMVKESDLITLLHSRCALRDSIDICKRQVSNKCKSRILDIT